jgi:ribosomal protein uL23
MSEVKPDPFYKFIKTPLITEKTVLQVEKLGKITFIVDINANKKIIKDLIEKRFDVKVKKVNTMISPRGEKKAIVTFMNVDDAMKVAVALGIF